MTNKRSASASKKSSKKLSKKEYNQQLYKLQAELCQLQEWVVKKGLRVIVLFEGRDAAGKGGGLSSVFWSVPAREYFASMRYQLPINAKNHNFICNVILNASRLQVR